MPTAPDPATIEPTSLVVGDIWTWKKSLDDHPADDGWTLTYRLIPQTGTPIVLTATADGDDHLVSVSSATTAGYTSGDYLMVGSVSDGTNRYEVYRADIEVKPNVTAAYDYRSYWMQVRDACQEALLDAAGRTEVSYVINSRSRTARSHDEILKLLAYAESQVANENAQGRNRKILIRFPST